MINIDYEYITSLIPDKLRRTDVRLEWLDLETRALASGHTDFKLDFDDFKFLSLHTAQVMSLEHLLNTLLTPLTDFYITDGNWYDYNFIFYEGELFSFNTYLYLTSESQPDTYFYNNTEYNDVQVDFNINIKIADAGLIKDIVYYTNLFVQGGKTYEIIQT